MGEYRGSCGVQLGPDADSAIDLRVNLWWKSIGLPPLIGIKLIKSILGIFPDRSARRDILRHDPSGARVLLRLTIVLSWGDRCLTNHAK